MPAVLGPPLSSAERGSLILDRGKYLCKEWRVYVMLLLSLAGEVKSVFDLIPAADRERLKRASEAASVPGYVYNIVF